MLRIQRSAPESQPPAARGNASLIKQWSHVCHSTSAACVVASTAHPWAPLRPLATTLPAAAQLGKVRPVLPPHQELQRAGWVPGSPRGLASVSSPLAEGRQDRAGNTTQKNPNAPAFPKNQEGGLFLHGSESRAQNHMASFAPWGPRGSLWSPCHHGP